MACTALSIAALLVGSASAARAQVSLPVGDLEDGGAITIEFDVTIAEPVTPGATEVCNQGTVAGDNFSPDIATDDPAVGGGADATCTALLVPIDLEVSKGESIDPVIAGSGAGNLTQVVTVFNNSMNFATGVALSEAVTVPAGVTVDSIVPSQGTFVDPTWSVGTLGPLGSATLTITYTVGASAAAGSDLVCDTAAVVAVNENDVDPSDDSATECTSIARQVDLQVSKAESVDPVIAGSGTGNLTYVVTVENAGPSDGSNVTLSEVLTLPAGVTVESVTPSQGTFTDPTWTVGDIAAGGFATLTVVLTAGPSAAADIDAICDTATVTGANEILVSTGDDSATECTSVARQIDLQVSKVESIDPVVAGTGIGDLTYVVTVENAGPSDGSNVTLSEVLTLPAGVTVESVTPSQGTFTDPTWTVGDIAAGGFATLTVVLTAGPSAAAGVDVICDTATVTGASEVLVNTGDDAATECTSVARQVDIVVSKTESVDPAIAGSGAGNLTYVVTVANAGPSDASDVALSEVVTTPSGVTVDTLTPSAGTFVDPVWTVGPLPAGSSATLTVVLTVAAAAAPGTDVICDTATLTVVAEPQVGMGNESATECTSIGVAADLSITKDDDIDPLPGGEDLTYTITVFNDGPSDATGVVVTDPLPAEVTYVSDTCAGSDLPPWTWDAGTLASGGMVSCDVVVSINPMPPGSISNTATVTSDVFDDDTSNNASTEETTLDNVPPQVEVVDTTPTTPGGSLEECETAIVAVHAFHVTFNEAMFDPPGNDTAGDVTNPAGYQLVQPGADLAFDTTACGGAAGDDLAIALPPGSVSYDDGSHTATIELGSPVSDSLYRLFACGTLLDAAGNPLDGDGNSTGGDDFLRSFRVDSRNIFVNGHFDCGADGWTPVTSGGAGQAWDPSTDADGSPESGAQGAFVASPSGGVETASLGQCVAVPPGRLDLSGRARLDLVPGANEPVILDFDCTFHSGPECGGSVLGGDSAFVPVRDSGGSFGLVSGVLEAPASTVSALCTTTWSVPAGAVIDGWLDQLTARSTIFADGFESGDTSAWTLTVP